MPRDVEPDPQEDRLHRLVGDRTAKALAALGVHTPGDLIRHYPRRYAEPGRMSDLSELVVGDHVTVMARVSQATIREMRSRGGVMMQATVTDGVRSLELTFFAKRRWSLRPHEEKLVPGKVGLFTGVVSDYRGARQLTHPDYLVVGVDADDEAAAMVQASRPLPIYPASAALPSWRIHQAVRTVLDPMAPAEVADPVPEGIRERRGLIGAHEALVKVHEPFTEADWRAGRERLRYEEAFVLQAALARRRAVMAASPAVARPVRDDGLLAAFDARLPFELTAGQLAVGAELAADLVQPRPMQRLLQGEVGSGKTVVALRAMLQVIDGGGQAALLAPTEVLAMQHARSLADLLGELAQGGMLGGADNGTRIALLTGSQGAAARRGNLLDAASGRAGIVVGTHALLSATVQFAELGLVVVDEQHRFGVEQRDLLRAKATSVPHLLVMTATPIPRTVAMTVFGDLETSTLTEIPAGRSAIVTHVVPASNAAWLARIWQRAREEIEAGNRVYVVCPRIEGDAAPDEEDGADLLVEDEPRPPLRAVLDVAETLRSEPALAGVRIEVLHGRMSAEDKDAAMARFVAGSAPLLVSTTVIEVGVDVQTATVMVIFDADRFGISQLHQLRGRVGRGSAPGLCLLVSDAPDGSAAATRLSTLAATTDGFVLANVDLELRREGDVLGAAQSGGRSSLRLLRVTRDADVIAAARSDAAEVITADPELGAHPALREQIERVLPGEREEFLDRA